MTAYEYRHRVCFEETSLVGNVYFSNYLLWQGHCRENFLHDHARGTLERVMRAEIALFTRSCTCEFVGDWGFTAADEVVVKMRLAEFRGGRMKLEFEFFNAARPGELVASGTQAISCKRNAGGTWTAAPFPPEMIRALLKYAERDELIANLESALEFQGGGSAAGAQQKG